MRHEADLNECHVNGHAFLLACPHPNRASMATSGSEAVRKSIRLWKPHPVSGRGKDGEEQAQAESLINPVTVEEPKRLSGSGQNGTRIGCGVARSSHQWSEYPPGERGVPPPSHLAGRERGKPHALPYEKYGQDIRKDVPQAQEEEEAGGSECRFVMNRIGIEPKGNIIPRESGQTSCWCQR